MIWQLVDKQTGPRRGDLLVVHVGDRSEDPPRHEMASGPSDESSVPRPRGGFLILSRDGDRTEPRVKDTGARARRADRGHPARRLEPRLWMAHCHIAEHAQSGMMFSFDVARSRAAAGPEEDAMAMVTIPCAGWQIEHDDAAGPRRVRRDDVLLLFGRPATTPSSPIRPRTSASGDEDRATSSRRTHPQRDADRLTSTRSPNGPGRRRSGSGSSSNWHLEPQDGAFRRIDVCGRASLPTSRARASTPTLGRRGLGDLTLGYLETAGGDHRSDRTFTELGEEIGISFETLERACTSPSGCRAAPDERVRSEDLGVLKLLPGFCRSAPASARATCSVSAVWGDSAARGAVPGSLLPHAVEEQFRRRGWATTRPSEAGIPRGGRQSVVWRGSCCRGSSVVTRTCSSRNTSSSTSRPPSSWRGAPRPPRHVEACAFAECPATPADGGVGDEIAALVSLTLAGS